METQYKIQEEKCFTGYYECSDSRDRPLSIEPSGLFKN